MADLSGFKGSKDLIDSEHSGLNVLDPTAFGRDENDADRVFPQVLFMFDTPVHCD